MDHDETREQLELAAVEPGGLDRLMAGDTATAQAVAAHVAGCPACADELARLQRVAPLIGAAVREMPSPDLKARTLAAIRSEGVIRPLTAATAGAAASGPSTTPAIPVETSPSSAPLAPPAPIDRRRRLVPAMGWVATIAAAVLLSIAGTALIVGNRTDTQIAAQEQTIDALEEVSTTALAVSAQPDGEHVTLTGVSDPTAAGSLAFSPSTTELVWLASGLTPPPAGYEYGCWVETGGTRQRIGKMFFSKDLAYWAGETEAVSGLSSGATFGLSLLGADGKPVSAEPVMIGSL
jgi:anti-sigma factor RsiW